MTEAGGPKVPLVLKSMPRGIITGLCQEAEKPLPSVASSNNDF